MKNLLIAMFVIVNFAWQPNTEPDLAGYRIFRRLPGQSFSTQPVADIPCGPNDTTCAKGYDDVVPGEYIWAAKAYDTEGYESDFSVEATSIITGEDGTITLILKNRTQ